MVEHPAPVRRSDSTWVWSVFVVLALAGLELLDLTVYGVVVPLAAAAIYAMLRRLEGIPTRSRGEVDRRDLWVIAGVYLVVVGLFTLAFRVFGTDRTLGLFLCFATGLIIGVVVPVVYTVWGRGRSLRSLGLGLHELPRTIALGLVFASVQFSLTLWGYDLPPPEDWVPLLVMALVVGMFESIFFRGFVQGRLSAAWGPAAGVGGAAVLYGLYHVGYPMLPDDIVFLFGLGVVYAIAYGLSSNLLVLWPLLTPLGSFYSNLDSGAFELPWASILGFADVAAVMVTVIVFAHRRERRAARAGASLASGEGIGRTAPPLHDVYPSTM
jgi:membrane protease YdiL (CAAX protease family)